jgi:hypothetical protein
MKIMNILQAEVAGEEKTVIVNVKGNQLIVKDYETKESIIKFKLINTDGTDPIIFITSR